MSVMKAPQQAEAEPLDRSQRKGWFRIIADTGHAMRRGEPYGFTSLVPYLTAPFWWIHPVASAYETIKTAQAFVMAAAIFPAYLLARMVVPPGWALFAAVGTIAAPALSYSPILV